MFIYGLWVIPTRPGDEFIVCCCIPICKRLQWFGFQGAENPPLYQGRNKRAHMSQATLAREGTLCCRCFMGLQERQQQQQQQEHNSPSSSRVISNFSSRAIMISTCVE